MATQLFKQNALLITKIESIYGTDSVPDANNNPFLVRNMSINPSQVTGCLNAFIEEPLMSSHKKAPLELLAELSAKARELAEALDNAALEIEQSFQNSEAQTVKLKQLQSLLKDIAE